MIMKKIKILIFTLITVIVTVLLWLYAYRTYRINHSITVLTSGADPQTGLYNTKPVSDAYLSKSPATLSDVDRRIYDEVVRVLGMIVTDDMSEYEKELAVHDYLVYNVSYDASRLNVFYRHDKDSENPYGALVNHKATCTGYATSFQMFMDMLEIPCMTIVANDGDGSDHAWNMVSLDDEWYYVDVAWDDPLPESEDSPTHKYFNVTERFLRENEHCWDSSKLPRADATKYKYRG